MNLMDFFYRDSARSPADRVWGREESRTKVDRDDTFYRGRSPGHDRRRSNRSRSPIPVDRYEPRRTRDDYPPRDRVDRVDRVDRDDRRRIGSPPANIDRYVPGQEVAPAQPLTNPIQDPLKLPYQVGFSYFGEWWRMNEKIKEEKERQRTGRRRDPDRPRANTQEERDKEKARIQLAYDSYKEDLQAKMAKTFVQQHKDEQWFRERYAFDVRDPLRAQLNEFRRGLYTQWEQDLESGTFDEFTLEGIPKSESNGVGGVIEKEEGEATAANEVLGVGDLVPATNCELRDENLFQPTLLIKTIAPSVSRQNLEAFCKEHLGEEEGGFKWLSLSDPNPSKRYHRIGWIMLHPAAETGTIIDRADPKEEDEDGDIKVKSFDAAPSTAEKALEAINSKTVKDEVRGDFVCHVGVHNPPANPRKKALWDLFSAPERIDKDLSLVHQLVNKFETDFGSDFNAVLKVEEKVDEMRSSGRLQPPITSVASKKEKVKRERIMNLDEAADEGEEPDPEDDDDEDDEGAAHDEEVDDEELVVKKKQLDLLIEYLRRVFNFCFFCVFESDSVHELTRKCPGGHLRRPRSTLSSSGRDVARASALGDPFPKKRADTAELEEGEATEPERKFRNASKTEQQLQRAYNWVKTFEDKIKQILEPESVDIRKLGGKPIDEAVADEKAKFVKQEDEHKWRCKVPDCTKLFKEEHFWHKHVEKRHVEWLDSLKQDYELINAYVVDPAHIAPSRTDANSNGHFPSANGLVPTGTPRGFNLSQYAINSMLPMGFPPPMPNFQQMFTGAMGTPASWGPLPGGDERIGGGPVRRPGVLNAGGRGYSNNNNRSNPYDRPRNPRFDGGIGGNPMGLGSGRQNRGGRWGDGAGGGAAVGPREAIQGRTIKSYEDLDQVSGSGGGELNY